MSNYNENSHHIRVHDSDWQKLKYLAVKSGEQRYQEFAGQLLAELVEDLPTSLGHRNPDNDWRTVWVKVPKDAAPALMNLRNNNPEATWPRIMHLAVEKYAAKH